MSHISCVHTTSNAVNPNPISIAMTWAAQLDRIPVFHETEDELLEIGDAVGGVDRAGFQACLEGSINTALHRWTDADCDETVVATTWLRAVEPFADVAGLVRPGCPVVAYMRSNTAAMVADCFA